MAGGLGARDINLDAIYLNTGSPLYEKLLEKKVEAYQAANAEFIDRDVIFASWGDGSTILYIKELPKLNVAYAYDRGSRKSRRSAGSRAPLPLSAKVAPARTFSSRGWWKCPAPCPAARP